MYWSASRRIWFSMSLSDGDAGMEMTLVMTADPATATAAWVRRVPERLTARSMAEPTASTSAMLFSTTACGGNGTTASLSTRSRDPLRLSSRSLTAVELISRPRTAGPFLLRNHKVFFLSRAQRRALFFAWCGNPRTTIINNRKEHNGSLRFIGTFILNLNPSFFDAVYIAPIMKLFAKVARLAAIMLAVMALLGVIVAAIINFYLVPQLPSADALRDVRYQVPLRGYTSDAKLLAEYGEMRRTPVTLAAVPDLMVNALLAAEDARCISHPGVDYQGLLRAGCVLLTTGQKAQGGSTITMQVARFFFFGCV